MDLFRKKPTIKGKYLLPYNDQYRFIDGLWFLVSIHLHLWLRFTEQVREGERAIRKETRNVERDRRGLEREEKKLEMEIKKAAKAGNKQACTVLAKQLVQLRKQKTRTYTATSQVVPILL